MAAFFQELLALEERIGNVNTGLSEETVTKLLKQRKFLSWRLNASSDNEPCCICQVLICSWDYQKLASTFISCQ
jgi:E3 ubiquitin-protein ligase Arkadia